MKAKLLACLIVFYLMLFSGCQNPAPVVSSSAPPANTSSISTETPLEQDLDTPLDLTEYEYKYFLSLAKAGITSQTWQSASQIEPDYLVEFFSEKTGLNRLSTDSKPIVISDDIVEPYVQLFFDVDASIIRQSNYYDRNSRSYRIPIASGGAAAAKVIAVSEKDDIITISYNYFSPSDEAEAFLEGSLDIRCLGPIEYHFVSCNTKSLENS